MNGQDDRMKELLGALRQLAANNERIAGEYLKLVRVLVNDSRQLAALVRPADAAEAVVVRGAMQRVEKVLGWLGDGERAN
jgi:uncharacterized protein YigA (DUF484 family)